jgi:hypothetical protein
MPSCVTSPWQDAGDRMDVMLWWTSVSSTLQRRILTSFRTVSRIVQLLKLWIEITTVFPKCDPWELVWNADAQGPARPARQTRWVGPSRLVYKPHCHSSAHSRLRTHDSKINVPGGDAVCLLSFQDWKWSDCYAYHGKILSFHVMWWSGSWVSWRAIFSTKEWQISPAPSWSSPVF